MSDNPDDRAAIEAMAKDAAQSDEWQWHLLQDEQQQAYLRRSTAALAALRDAGWWVERWRPISDRPDFMHQPHRQFIRVEGWSAHDGGPHVWARVYCGEARISPDTHWGYAQADLDRIMKFGDMDGIDAITHWMPAAFPPPPPEPSDV